MNDMLDDIPDDRLRDKLQHYSENPDERVWQGINSGLSHAQTPMSERLKNFSDQPDGWVWKGISRALVEKRMIAWAERAATIIAAVSIMLLMYPFVMNKPVETTALNKDPILNTPPDNAITAPEQSRERTASALSADDIQPTGTEESRTSSTIAVPKVYGLTPPQGSHIKAPEESKRVNKSTRTSDSVRNAGEKNKSSSTFEIEEHYETATSRQDLAGHAEGLPAILEETISQTVSRSGEDQRTDTTSMARNSLSTRVQDQVAAAVNIDSSVLTVTPTEKAVVLSKEDEREETKSGRRRGLYALLMPTFGYQHISPLTDDNIIIESIEKVATFSFKRLGIRGEAGYEMYVTPRLGVNIGILYYQRKQTIQYDFLETENFQITKVFSDSLLYSVSHPQQTESFEYELKNIGILAGMSYTLHENRILQRIGFAAEIHKSLVRVNPEVDTGQKFYLFGNVYYRISYPVGRYFHLIVQPTFNYSFEMDERLNAPFYVKPFGLGLNFGCYFDL